MAQITQDTKVLSDSTGQEVKEQALENEGGGVRVAEVKNLEQRSSSTPSVAVTNPHTEKTPSISTNAQSNEPPSRPSLVPLGSANVQTSSVTPVAPHPKRFNAVNINKKFLEKNTVSGSASTASASITKSGSPSTRPSVQPTSSHSRLVTAKLTASPAVGSSTAGWSRPSSVAPSPATNSPSSTSPLPTAAVVQPSTTAAPQLPHVGKVILPQPRSSVTQSSSQKDGGSNKPVWGAIKPPSVRPDIEPSDFPTAAEVANVTSTARKQTRPTEEKAISDTAAKQLRSEEADAFRGVHLDPNVHHWDEMEEDDDNFLGGVIEFGDGRQYKIESSESIHPGAPPRSQEEDSHSKESAVPVSKEERFVDDFDRSWPKSRNSPASASKDVSSTTHGSTPNLSPVISNATHSPQDSSRVLFNERSNRLEPYSQAHRQQPPFGNKRSHYQEGSGPQSDSRPLRDGSQNIQVLQKPPVSDFSSRSRRFSGSGGNTLTNHPNGYVGDRNREREPLRRDGPPPSPRLPRDQDPSSRDSQDRGRKVPMGPPPVPPHALQRPQDGGRQLPPHLSQRSPNVPQRRLPSRDSRFSPSDTTSALPVSASGRIPPQSPATSQASLTHVSPIIAPATTIPLAAPDIDEARKGLMHTAAERAKQRRQQEEEEREAQKERARRKAAELEEKMKAANAEKEKSEKEATQAAAKEQEVVDLIEEAVKSAEGLAKSHAEPAPRRLSLQRPPSLRGVTRPVATDPRPATARRPSTTTTPLTPLATSQTDSWRTRSNPVPPSPLPRQIQSRPPVSAGTFIPSGPSAAEQVETIADESKDDLEVVDFSEMGKFVGVPEVSEVSPDKTKEDHIAESTPPKHSRPVASDFFDDPTVSSIPSSKKVDFGVWRKRVSQDSSIQKPEESKPDDDIKKADTTTSVPDRLSSVKDYAPPKDNSSSPDAAAPSTKEPLLHLDAGQTVHVPHSPSVQRTPRAQTFYKEATVSSIEDAMSRIKGVLVTMKTHDSPKEISPSGSGDQEVQPRVNLSTHALSTPSHPPPNRERWVPPALRLRKFDDSEDHEPREIFLVTMSQPPSSPNGKLTVRLPSISYRRELVSKRQLNAFHRPAFQARMDILSFDPPVYDMNRRDLSLNDVLFRKPPYSKGRSPYQVSLPSRQGPKVNIPTKPNGTGAFGRPTVADGATSWRKATVPPTPKVDFVKEEIGLDTTSRSPPPDSTPPETHVASIPKSNDHSPTRSESGAVFKSRTQPKMPAGLAVGFRRDSRIIEAEAAPMVNFIVGSQLDEDISPQGSSTVARPVVTVEEKSEAVAVAVNGLSKSLSTSTAERAAIVSPKVESTDALNDRTIVAQPSHSTNSWSRSSLSLPIKESPARAPDPEHLKAVWSQTSNKPGLHSVNSLEGIADDLTALPFTLQDVKSEDGETPPPTLPSAPSRMSLHEVTRAFQTVPTSSSASSQPPHRATFSPPSTHAPVARPTTGTYTYSPAAQNNLRPAYLPYPSPMISHSPAPVMYGPPMGSNPVPNRMQTNGHTPLYSQPMWVTMPPPASQPHGNMMRPVVSPYPAQMMAYPSPGYGPQPPPPNIMHAPQNAGRGRGMPMMSPVVSHAHAHPGTNMYGGSPVMMHAVQVPQNLGYMPMPAGRGQPRTDNGPQQQQQHNAHNQPQPPHNGFNPAPTQSFRPTW